MDADVVVVVDKVVVVVAMTMSVEHEMIASQRSQQVRSLVGTGDDAAGWPDVGRDRV